MPDSFAAYWARSCARLARRRIALLLAGGLMIAGCRSARVVAPPELTRVSPSASYGRLVIPPPRTPEKSFAANPWEPTVAARKWRYVVLHHTAGEEGSIASIDSAHRKRVDANGNPWLGIGYHFVIGNGHGMGDGAIEPTFRWQEQLHGAHAGNDDYNQYGIGIALVGDFETGVPTPAQRESAARLVQTLSRAYDIPADHVVPHRDIRATACPGKNFPLSEITYAAAHQSYAALPSAAHVGEHSGSLVPVGHVGHDTPIHPSLVFSSRSP